MKKLITTLMLAIALTSTIAPKANAGVFYLVKSAIHFSNDEIGKGIVADLQGVTDIAGGILLATNGISFTSFGQSLVGAVAITLIALGEEDKTSIKGLVENISEGYKVDEDTASELIDRARVTVIEGTEAYNIELDCSTLDADELEMSPSKLEQLKSTDLCK
jgi:uncharacterized protein (DUF342 family)